jgi:hypothetical protein
MGVPFTTILSAAVWNANAPYALGASVVPVNINDPAQVTPQKQFVCIAAGTSGSSPPSWTKSDGTTVTDGTVTWLNYGWCLDCITPPPSQSPYGGFPSPFPPVS